MFFFNDIPAKPTFPAKSKYHRCPSLLLPSSEWSRVVHDELDHREVIEEKLF